MRNRKRLQGILRIVSFILCIPLIYVMSAVTLPYVKPFFENAAAISAGLSFLEGGKSAMKQDFIIDDNLQVNNDTESVPYDEYVPPQSQSSSSQTESASSSSTTSSDMPNNTGKILKQTYKAGTTALYIPLNNGYIKNCTKLSIDTIKKAVEQKPKFKIKADKKPEVLIMHTHTTESFESESRDWFYKGSTSRTTDNTKNMVRIGDEIEKQLTAAGIGVIHDKTLHDYPSYNGAYERSAVTVKRILKENPSIKVVLDVHRDAIQPDENTMIAPVTTINGKSCAQVMIISGCDNGKMGMPNYMENLKFSASLQRQMEKDYPTLARPILFDYRKYNQNLTTGSILLEMGGHANSLDEAIYCGQLVGDSLAKTLASLK
ncbi:stage II sporulation protein P [Paludicola sp. MB14-C6]|uniref:stage II sporulation protein P n=1 Tax=Paludihabitans sp. MB14-C6 TaxID=3070656 RepID=UPI0027DC95A3|nr:stage II sporulation protein P [Paludicola sp. MB14-C6]WMJ23952.1 stage II sporulation protein P [Paludicola sp. MB14-C6]